MRITSLQNARIKNFAKLRGDAAARRQQGLMLVEGRDEIALARSAGHSPLTILTCEELVRQQLATPEAEILAVTPGIFKKLSVRENPDGWLAIFRRPKSDLNDLRLSTAPLVVVVEGIEKPGNLGAILRTCDAAGVEAMIVCDPRADVYGPNVVRASRGTVFTVPVATADGAAAVAFLRQRGIRIAAASPAGQKIYTGQDLRGPLAIAVGTEDAGLSHDWISRADFTVRIPMTGRINSLNVSVATAVLVYEAVRQRTG